jgi:hypothetical protein
LTISDALAAGFARRRRELRRTPDEIAQTLRLFGFDWTRATVAAYERGERKIVIEELLGLLAAYSTNLPAVLDGFGSLQITSGVAVPDHRVIRWLAEGEAAKPGEDPFADPNEAEARFDAETKAAASFGVEPIVVVRAAHRLWGRGLTAERERRMLDEVATVVEKDLGAVPDEASADRTARTLQAKRGHVTRELLAELRPEVERMQRRRRKPAAKKKTTRSNR